VDHAVCLCCGGTNIVEATGATRAGMPSVEEGTALGKRMQGIGTANKEWKQIQTLLRGEDYTELIYEVIRTLILKNNGDLSKADLVKKLQETPELVLHRISLTCKQISLTCKQISLIFG